MSIYSGFGTRQQETFYNKITLRALEMLSDRVIAFIRADPFDEENWYYHLRKIFKYMQILETNKYLPPKFSSGISKLMSHYKKYINLPENSTSTLTSRSFFLNQEMNKTYGATFAETPNNEFMNEHHSREGVPPSVYLSTGYSTKQNAK